MTSSDKHRSGEYITVDPAVLLAMRVEIDAALAPFKKHIDEKFEVVSRRLSAGDTEFALLKREQEGIKRDCVRHAIGMDDGKPVNPYWVAFITGALTSIGTAAGMWFLIGVGQQAAKVAP